MSADWQVGNLALCVQGGRGKKLVARIGDSFYLENGDRTLRVERGVLYRVANVAPIIGPDRQLALGFEESAGPWLATRFRKIKPDSEPCEEEFVTLIKRMKPAKVQA